MRRQLFLFLLTAALLGAAGSVQAGPFHVRRAVREAEGLGVEPFNEFSDGTFCPDLICEGDEMAAPDGFCPEESELSPLPWPERGRRWGRGRWSGLNEWEPFYPQDEFYGGGFPAYGEFSPEAGYYPQTSGSYEIMPKKSLFNGRDLTGWTAREGAEPPKGWTVEDGAIHMKEPGDNLYTAGEYENFILEFEFRIEKKGANSGLKYKTWKTDGWGMGCEYQIFDDSSAPNQKPQYRTASLYDVYEPVLSTDLSRLGEYNKGKIVVMGNYIEHWLNGVRTVSATIDSAEWKARVAKSKFAEEPKFGHVGASRLFLQDHGSEVWFRNIELTELRPCPW